MWLNGFGFSLRWFPFPRKKRGGERSLNSFLYNKGKKRRFVLLCVVMREFMRRHMQLSVWITLNLSDYMVTSNSNSLLRNSPCQKWKTFIIWGLMLVEAKPRWNQWCKAFRALIEEQGQGTLCFISRGQAACLWLASCFISCCSVCLEQIAGIRNHIPSVSSFPVCPLDFWKLPAVLGLQVMLWVLALRHWALAAAPELPLLALSYPKLA